MERLKWPGLALLLAALGAVVRRWQITSAFEGELRLSVPNAPASWALIAFYAVVLAMCTLLAWSEKFPVQLGQGGRSLWDQAFAARRDPVYLVAVEAGALLTLAAALFLFRDAAEMNALRQLTGEGDSPLLQFLLGVLVLPGAFAMGVTAFSAFSQRGQDRGSVFLLLPSLMSCMWLLEGYRSNAADPVLWDYVPLLLAVAAGLAFQLECAGLALSGRANPRRMLWLGCLTAGATGAALIGSPNRAMTLLLAGQLLNALAALWAAPCNLRKAPV